MLNDIALDQDDKVIFKKIIDSLPYTIYAYGSRVKNHHHKFSDLDLCLKENISDVELGDIKEIFDESNITIKIDIKRRHDMNDDFFNLIKNDLVLIKDISEKTNSN